ncbi:MAG: ATP-binding protein [Pseudomonadota bacterium]
MAVFPFSAIVGQDELKTALILSAIDRSIGGVLAFGDRGTGKSTAVRALAGLLPPMRMRAGCLYNCAPGAERPGCTCEAPETDAPVPVIDLPLGATEDRITGALDLEKALTLGEKQFEPGLLARAHRGFLYIDEVNLLEDHLVDLLLDVAASGVNVVEREGLSVRHPAEFVLIGSGNPEEGELRPQLLDRFGLSVEVSTPMDVPTRIEVIRRRDAFERDRAGFAADWAAKDMATSQKIAAASERLDAVKVPDKMLERAAGLAIALGTDGLRGELTLMRTARALATWEGKARVALGHLRQAAPMVMRHRLRRDPLDEAGSTARVMRAVEAELA